MTRFSCQSSSCPGKAGKTCAPVSSALSPSHLHIFCSDATYLPALRSGGGTNGPLIFAPAVRNHSWSLVTGDSTGAPSRQSGKSSSSARGSITAPESPWFPISPPFSMTRISSARPEACASCPSRIAVARPAGPAPTTRTSTSSRSRCGIFFYLNGAEGESSR